MKRFSLVVAFVAIAINAKAQDAKKGDDPNSGAYPAVFQMSASKDGGSNFLLDHNGRLFFCFTNGNQCRPPLQLTRSNAFNQPNEWFMASSFDHQTVSIVTNYGAHFYCTGSAIGATTCLATVNLP